MATTIKKGSKNTKAKPRRPVVKMSPAKQPQTIAELRQELAESLQRENATANENVRCSRTRTRNAELREALEHQTATAECSAIISRSPTDVQPVLDAIVESAARVCGIDDVLCDSSRTTVMIPRAHFGSMPTRRVRSVLMEPQFRWMREHGTLHIPDVRRRTISQRWVHGSWIARFLAVPLRQQGEFIGSLIARRTEVRPFTPSADQAARNLCRPGGHRHRERAAVPRTQGGVGAADGDE